MAKISLAKPTSGYNLAAINQNFTDLESEFQNKVLYRDNPTGEPNHMLSDLDMNGRLILNQANPVTVEGFNWEGPWLASQQYTVGDIVSYDGASYICIVNHTSIDFPTDITSQKWQLVVTSLAPDPTGNAGKFLQTNGAISSWEVPDASELSFTQSGTGAAATTVQTKLRESVSVKDFGAVGDGVTDDTSAFTAAGLVGKPVFVPAGSYSLSSLAGDTLRLLFGPGVILVAGNRAQISSDPFVDNNSSHVRVYNPQLQPSKWPTVDGSLRNGAISINATRTGGFGSYGLSLTEYLVADSIPSGEFDVGVTSWVTAQNVGGGQVFGAWAGANTPSSALSQTFTSGAAVGQETNVGNRWGDFGLLDDIGAGRYTIGHQIVPDVLPALDGTTAAIYPGSFGEVLAPSIHGHKWWTGFLVSSDAIQPGGRVFNVRGGSVVGNATGSLLRAVDFFTRGIDFSGATISTQAILFGADHTISWGAGGGSNMSGTATTFGLSTGTGTGEGGLFADNYSHLAMRWSSSGSAARIGFLGAAAITRPTVSGSKGANAALSSLLTALANLGLVTDTTT